MFKKLFVSTCILLASIAFGISISLANDGADMLKDAANGARNIVGGTENAIENAAGGISNTSKNITNDMENAANSTTNSFGNSMGTTKDTNDNTNNRGYVASRTSTDGNAATFMGMTATAWTWLIMGIATIAIVALVWYYANQTRTSSYDDRD